jgi:hypothetical protein
MCQIYIFYNTSITKVASQMAPYGSGFQTSSLCPLLPPIPSMGNSLPHATSISMGTSTVHQKNCTHHVCWWRENVAGLKLISCNYIHFAMSCVYSCDIWVTQTLQQNPWAKNIVKKSLPIWASWSGHYWQARNSSLRSALTKRKPAEAPPNFKIAPCALYNYNFQE